VQSSRGVQFPASVICPPGSGPPSDLAVAAQTLVGNGTFAVATLGYDVSGNGSYVRCGDLRQGAAEDSSEVVGIAGELNGRPRRTLGGLSPSEAIAEAVSSTG